MSETFPNGYLASHHCATRRLQMHHDLLEQWFSGFRWVVKYKHITLKDSM
jgi:hypothetical protein